LGIVFEMKIKLYSYFCPENCLTDFFSILKALVFRKIRQGAIINFQKKFSSIINRRNSFTFGSGRMALFAILKALEIKVDDEIIIQAFTCNVVPRAILSVGALPIYADIVKSNFNIDFEDVKKLINSKTKAVIIQHTFGLKPNISELIQFLDENDITIIEDCAHCLTPINDPRLNIDKGLVFFSTDHTKLVNTHVGGVASCNDPKIAQRLASLQSDAKGMGVANIIRLSFSIFIEVLAQTTRLYTLMRPFFFVFRKSPLYFSWDDGHDCGDAVNRAGGIYKFSWLQAVVGLKQLEKIDQIITHRLRLSKALNIKYSYYNHESGLPTLRYAFLVDDREAFYQLNYSEVKHSTWFVDPITGGRELYEELKYSPGSCPIAELVSSKMVNLPLSSKIPVKFYK